MSLTPDGRVAIPVDLDECKVELLGGRHSATQEAWVLALCEEIERLRERSWNLALQVQELERKQFVGDQ